MKERLPAMGLLGLLCVLGWVALMSIGDKAPPSSDRAPEPLELVVTNPPLIQGEPSESHDLNEAIEFLEHQIERCDAAPEHLKELAREQCNDIRGKLRALK